MEYSMKMTDQNFSIKKENFQQALDNLKDIYLDTDITANDYVDGKAYLQRYMWVNAIEVLKSKTLDEAMKAIRYKPLYDSNGNINSIEFTGQRFGDEGIFFNALRPFVVSGSYLCFAGDDGTSWKWSFDDGKIDVVFLYGNEGE